MDKYTLEEIEAAILRACGNMTEANKAASRFLAEKIVEELTCPKHKFAEGQVRAWKYNYSWIYSTEAEDSDPTCRNLTLTELGPAVRELRDAAFPRRCAMDGELSVKSAQRLRRAIEAFDEAHPDE